MTQKMFPLAFYYDGPEGRIIMTNSIAGCSEWVENLRSTDFVLFTEAWHIFGPRNALDILEHARFPENLYFLCNDHDSMFVRSNHGVRNCFLLHKNAWIDHGRFRILEDCEQHYDAVYNARLAPFKRHYLAGAVGDRLSLALVCGHHFRTHLDETVVPRHAFMNDWHLSPERVCQVLNSSKVALALSQTEGGCFASTEYLLCGLPVVSTKSHGGRDYWYNKWNSIIVEDDAEAVYDGVDYFLRNPPDRHRIRQQAVDEQLQARRLLVEHVLQPILSKLGSARRAVDVFNEIDLHQYGAFRGRIWRNLAEVQEIIQAPPGKAVEWSARVEANRPKAKAH